MKITGTTPKYSSRLIALSQQTLSEEARVTLASVVCRRWRNSFGLGFST